MTNRRYVFASLLTMVALVGVFYPLVTFYKEHRQKMHEAQINCDRWADKLHREYNPDIECTSSDLPGDVDPWGHCYFVDYDDQDKLIVFSLGNDSVFEKSDPQAVRSLKSVIESFSEDVGRGITTGVVEGVKKSLPKKESWKWNPFKKKETSDESSETGS